jgi:NAD(P)-dependent dehydrogenase (short-subunit alcohol dehydrogenase family)
MGTATTGAPGRPRAAANRFRPRPLAEQTIVVTGASSGIGLATATRAAARGANVVLVARSGGTLDDVAAAIERDGGTAMAVEADVAQRDELERVATATIDRFGGFDTWVNDAGVDVWAPIDAVSDDDNRRLFETNFWGTVYGSLIAVAHFADHGGTVINIGSLESDRAFPLQGMYSATKHAVKGFTDALRMEVGERGLPISVTLVKPGSIGTPLPDHAKTYFSRDPRLPRPVYHPDEVAHAILSVAQRPTRDVYVGGQAAAIGTLGHLVPRILDVVSERFFIEPQFRDRPANGRADNLHHAQAAGRVTGEDAGPLSRSVFTRAALRPGATAVSVALASAGVVAFRRRR